MLDLILIALIVGSTLFGLFRGLLSMLVGVLGWVLASWATWRLGDWAGSWLSGGSEPALGKLLAGHALVFLVVMVGVSLAAFVVRKAMETVHLTLIDRLLGMALGALRGLLLAAVVVLFAGFTPVALSDGWQSSAVVPWVAPVSTWMREKLPSLVAAAAGSDESDMGNAVSSGDNVHSNDIATGEG